jgi:hypothetical protein
MATPKTKAGPSAYRFRRSAGNPIHLPEKRNSGGKPSLDPLIARNQMRQAAKSTGRGSPRRI